MAKFFRRMVAMILIMVLLGASVNTIPNAKASSTISLSNSLYTAACVSDDAAARYIILFTNGGTLTEVSKPTIYVDGVAVAPTETSQTYFHNRSGYVVLYLQYADVQAGATQAANITQHIITIKEGTAVGQYALAEDVHLKVQGSSVSTNNGPYVPPETISLSNSLYTAACVSDDAAARYIILFTNDGTLTEVSKPTIYVDGAAVAPTETSQTYFHNRAGYVVLYLQYSDVQAGATKATDITKHVITIKSGTAVGQYMLAEDVHLKVQGTSISANSGPYVPPSTITLGAITGGGAQEGSGRYMITFENTEDVGATSVTGYIDGSEEGVQNAAHIQYYGGRVQIFLYYSAFGATSCSEITEHIITFKAGTQLDNDYTLAEDVHIKVKGNSFSLVKKITLGKIVGGGSQDGSGRYMISLENTEDVGVTSVTGYIDGSEEGVQNAAYIWYTGGRIQIFLYYSAFGATSAAEIGKHIVTIKAGTELENNYVLAEDIHIRVHGSDFSLVNMVTLGEVTGGGTQTERYMITFENTEDVGITSVTGYIDGSEKGVQNAGYIWYLSGRIQIFLYYSAFGATSAAEVGEHIITFKAGTELENNYILAEDVHIKVQNGNFNLIEMITLDTLSADGEAQDSEGKYFIPFYNTTDCEGEVDVYVDGKLSEQKVRFENIDGKVTLILPYNIVQANAMTSSEIGKHNITIKAGSLIGNYRLYNEINLRLQGSEFELFKWLTLDALSQDGKAQEENGRYYLPFDNIATECNAEVAVYIDGELSDQKAKVISVSEQAILILPYTLVQNNASSCYDVSGHTVVIKAGTEINQYELTKDLNLRVHANAFYLLEEYDISDYRENGVYEYPTQDGMIFAGWYTDLCFKNALDKETTIGTAYAKFVDEDVLSVKAQVTKEATPESDKVDFRFISTVDSLDYKEVGFDIHIEGREKKRISTESVYKKLYAVGNQTVDTIEADELCAMSDYFFTYSYWQVPKEHFETLFTVTPYWETMDGTVVYGETGYRFVNLGLKQWLRTEGPSGEITNHTELQANYLADSYENIALYAPGNQELSKPNATILDWTLLESKAEIGYYKVEFGLDEKLKDAIEYEVEDTEFSIYNLDIATTYYWRVTAMDINGIPYTSDISSFSISGNTPRFLNIDGVTNARDVGGWKTSDGKQIRTGMIYRTATLENITSEGQQALKDLGVITEIEFRQWITVDQGSSVGEDVQFFVCPISADVVNVLDSNASASVNFSKSIRKYFAILADENNYPMVTHCGGGMDRTGFFTFLLEGLLGVEEEDLYRDYLLSSFCNIAARTPIAITEYLEVVNACEGDTLQQRFYNYLHTVHDVPTEDLESVISVMKSE